MKQSTFTEEQIAFALKQAETGTRVENLCFKMGISQATFYAWRKKFGGLGVALPSCAGYASSRKRTASSSSWSPM
ncbi:transposase [Xanthomonas bromi]|uniref:Transposase n=1 Tax=Xanthomonas bromi TaxID=56449 RepID=A0A1C3NP41_9XANT|nr:transposase [Xanthomonas bromi]